MCVFLLTSGVVYQNRGLMMATSSAIIHTESVCISTCICWAACTSAAACANCAFVWTTAGQTERVMTADMLSIFQTERKRRRRGVAGWGWGWGATLDTVLAS